MTFKYSRGLEAQPEAALVPDTTVIAGTTYTLRFSNRGRRLRFTSASAVTITVPAGLGLGFETTIEQAGAGQLSFVASGTTINNVSGHTKTSGQYAVVVLLGGEPNVYTLAGSTGA